MKNKVIIYGLGKAYYNLINLLEAEYEIVGVCDKNPNRSVVNYTFYTPDELLHVEFDYIFVTSRKYYEEIKEELVVKFKLQSQQIISQDDIWGEFHNSGSRDSWVTKKLSGIPDGKTILDAGAGEQRYRGYCNHLKYIAQDFGEYIPEEIDSGLQSGKWDYTGIDIKCDIINMPLDDASIDVILCTEVFEHIKNPILALQEFSRILKPGGTLLLTAPVCSLTHMAPYYYYNGFSEYWYKDNLMDCKFEILELTRYGNYFEFLGQELFRLNEICKRYTDYNINLDEISSISNVIKLLPKLSQADNGSSELLCFGTMIEARKIL